MSTQTPNPDDNQKPPPPSGHPRTGGNGKHQTSHPARKFASNMPIEIRLKELLQKHQLDSRGVTQRIATDLGLHRHTIGKIYRNQLSNPSLSVLASICAWIHNQKSSVPLQQILAGLLVIRPPELWQAIAAPGQVSIWLGNHVQAESEASMWAWISQQDAETMKDMVALLSDSTHFKPQPTVTIDSVPFRYVHGQPDAVINLCKDDKEAAQRLFKDLLKSIRQRSHILIGSQRVNYLLECFVAHLFGCRPFVPNDSDIPKVPFHHVYRPDDHCVPSCFGGRTLPGRRDPKPGLYYLDEHGKWQACHWERDRQDAAIVIVWRDPRAGGVLLAVFGFSGRATLSIGRYITGDSREFWNPDMLIKDRHITVYYCSFQFGATRGDARDPADPGQMSVVPLARKVIEDHTRGRHSL